MKTIFLIGPWSTLDEKRQSQFTKVADLISGQEKNVVVTPLDFLPNSTNNLKLHKLMLSKMLACDLVVTLPDWYEDKECTEFISVARMVNIPVKSVVVYVPNSPIPLN